VETPPLTFEDFIMGLNTRLETASDATASALTDSSGGTAGQTIAAIGSEYSQAEVRNAVASLARQVNRLITDVSSLRDAINAGE
jgi:hypothetical protein